MKTAENAVLEHTDKSKFYESAQIFYFNNNYYLKNLCHFFNLFIQIAEHNNITHT
jgi:hypothetical protein